MNSPIRTLVHLLVAFALLAPLTPSGAFAQGLNEVFSQDGVDVWALGDDGQYLRSFTGGSSWTLGTLGTQPLRGVAARNFNVVVVGDSGKIWRSVNSGGAWSVRALPGAPALRALQMPTDSVLFTVGAGGRIAKSTDGGGTWTTLASGTTAKLNSVRFRDARHGWVVGDGGVAMHTDDGGDTWLPVSVPTTSNLLSVDVLGAYVWIGGERGVVLQSFDNGVHWMAVDLNLEVPADIQRVWIDSPSRVIVVGGGGFMRVTPDSGGTWTFMKHPILGGVHALFFAGAHGWACGHGSRALESTSDGGETWALTPATAVSGDWPRTLLFNQTPTALVRGNSIAPNSQRPEVLYAALGSTLYRSPDRGGQWRTMGSVSDGTYIPSRVNAFYVSPRDSNIMVIAAAGTGASNKRILRSIDRGATWTTTMISVYSEYGVPLEMNVDHPDTLLFGPEDGSLYRSLDFGATWSTVSNPGFRSPCDIQIVPGDNANVWVGDGVTGQGQGAIWQSLDGGLTFALRYPLAADSLSDSAEIPMMACPRLDNRLGFASHWPTGGMSITEDGGATWTQMTTTQSAWGTDIAHDDPTVGAFAVFGGSSGFITTDRGANFDAYTLFGSNYSVFAYDRATILAVQSGGIYKLRPSYTTPLNNSQFLNLEAPLGAQTLTAGQVRQIAWSATNIAIVRVEYRLRPTDAWRTLADVPGHLGSFAWTVPDSPSTTVRLRVRDQWDGSPSDSSAVNLTIAAPRIAVNPASLDFGTRPVGSATLDTLRFSNPGTGPLTIGPLSLSGTGFTLGRTSLSLAAGSSDTIGVTFRPTLGVQYGATLTAPSNAPGAALQIPLEGTASDTLRLTLTAPVGGEAWQVGTTRWIQWQSAQVNAVSIDWQSAPGAWTALADSVPASEGVFSWTLPNAPTAQARVRVRERSGSARDSSAAPFTITVPHFAASPALLSFGPVTVGSAAADTLHIANTGNAPIMISWIASDRPAFSIGRTWMTLAAGGSDSLGIVFAPSALGRDTATVTFVSDDPASPHTVRVAGEGVSNASASSDVPLAFGLTQNTPNPFGGRTVIRYALPVRSQVALEVFNLQGQRVATLARGEQPAGTYAVSFAPGSGEVRSLPAGVYFYRLRAGTFEATRKLLLMR